MKIILFLLFLFLACSNTACFSQSVQTITPVQGGIENSANQSLFNWDFGKVKEGDIVRHNFILKNQTDKTIHIEHIRTSCGCTASEAKKKKLLAGEQTDIEVKFNTKGYKGYVEQYVYVTTDNQDNPILKFVIKANVVKE